MSILIVLRGRALFQLRETTTVFMLDKMEVLLCSGFVGVLISFGPHEIYEFMLLSFQLLPWPCHVSSLEGPAVPQWYVLTLLSTTSVMLTAMLERHYGMYNQWLCAQNPHSHWHKLHQGLDYPVWPVLQVADVDPSQWPTHLLLLAIFTV